MGGAAPGGQGCALFSRRFFGWTFGSFPNGVLYPVVSQFLFGMIGGFLGALIVLGTHKLQNRIPPI